MTLIEWRQRKGLNQTQVAVLLGVDPAMVSRWERGERAPSLQHAKTIMEVTRDEVTLADLVRTAERG